MMVFALLDAGQTEITLPLSAWISIGSALATVLGTYFAMRGELTKLRDQLADARNKNAELAQGLRIVSDKAAEWKQMVTEAFGDLRGRLAVAEKSVRHLEEAQASAVTLAEFDSRTKAQDDLLKRIDRRLDAGARTASQNMRAADGRREPSEPPEPPPMRRKLPSIRGGE